MPKLVLCYNNWYSCFSFIALKMYHKCIDEHVCEQKYQTGQSNIVSCVYGEGMGVQCSVKYESSLY